MCSVNVMFYTINWSTAVGNAVPMSHSDDGVQHSTFGIVLHLSSSCEYGLVPHLLYKNKLPNPLRNRPPSLTGGSTKNCFSIFGNNEKSRDFESLRIHIN
ncbi:hypothetical protein NQ315_010838 [Exocentrus adspersus]|uniref:Uncharacterized protein n=1 Tax=Exocentrus adspersus TaxID=1586481 RepID=A0AAV8V7F8_9CUCU|nr:hypothetical protein NQ315_010838 [Exocentrus adspersus]